MSYHNHSEESNEMILNHPDIETIENIQISKQKINKKSKNTVNEDIVKLPEKKILITKQKESQLKKMEIQKIKEEKKQQLSEKKEQRELQLSLKRQQLLERKEQKQLELLEKQQQVIWKSEERRKMNEIKEEMKMKRLEEKKIAEEEHIRKRKEKALKGMKYLLSVSTKYSDFFREKIIVKKKDGSTIKPLREKNKLQPTLSDMKEAVDCKNAESCEKDPNYVVNQLRYFEGELRDYQIEGVQWMVNLFDNGINGILADEMGLGKTAQIIALLSHLMERNIPGPYLIVVPLSTIPHWEMEFARFAPKIPVVIFYGSEEERKQTYKLVKRKYDLEGNQIRPVVITSYQVTCIEQDFINKFEWQYIIVDEGHKIKNHKSQLSGILRSFTSSNRLLLTGTPIHNNITELWALLNFLMPQIFNHVDTFASLLMLDDVEDENKLIEQEEKTNFLTTLHKVLEPFVLKRLKSDVLGDLVPKKELHIYCPLTKIQHELYNYVIDKNTQMLLNGKQAEPLEPRRKRKRVNYYIDERDDYSDYEDETLKDITNIPIKNIDKKQVETINRVTMTNPMTMFKKIVDHPYLVHFPLDPNSARKQLLINEDLILSSGKMMVLDQVLARLKKDGHKVLIFSTLVIMLDLIEELFIMRGLKYCRLDGRMNISKRKESINSFNNDPDILGFLLSTRAGGLGINLTAADTVIFFDRDWNPQVDIQAQDRCHRIGQTKPVMVYTLVAKNTIDSVIINTGYKKRLLEKIIIKDGKFCSADQTQSMKILEELQQLQKVLKESVTDFNNLKIPAKQLDKLLDRSELLALMNKSA